MTPRQINLLASAESAQRSHGRGAMCGDGCSSTGNITTIRSIDVPHPNNSSEAGSSSRCPPPPLYPLRKRTYHCTICSRIVETVMIYVVVFDTDGWLAFLKMQEYALVNMGVFGTKEGLSQDFDWVTTAV